jgi:hypothetical protein
MAIFFLSKQGILFSMSSELKTFKLEGAGISESAASASPPNSTLLELLPHDHPLALEMRSSEINFDDLLKTKINTKGTTLQDQKKRLDDQKNLILKLRDGDECSMLRHKCNLDFLWLALNRCSVVGKNQGLFDQQCGY